MKIRGKELESGESGLKIDRAQKEKQSSIKARTHEGKGSAAETDKVNLNLSRAIQSELDPVSMAAERRAKVEELKRLVKSGSYKPPVDEVARAVGSELVYEIVSQSGPKFDDD